MLREKERYFSVKVGELCECWDELNLTGELYR